MVQHDLRGCPGRLLGFVRSRLRVPGCPIEYLTVTGDSMLPTLRDGDWVLAWRTTSAAVGHVVVAARPDREGLWVVKRVAELRPEGYWLIGDNSGPSSDSRTFGAVPEVVARVVWRVKPWGPLLARPLTGPRPVPGEAPLSTAVAGTHPARAPGVT